MATPAISTEWHEDTHTHTHTGHPVCTLAMFQSKYSKIYTHLEGKRHSTRKL